MIVIWWNPEDPEYVGAYFYEGIDCKHYEQIEEQINAVRAGHVPVDK